MARVRLDAPADPPIPAKRERLSTPLLAPAKTMFTTSGSHMLDQVLGGGWARDRVFNLVGDRSSGKTLLAIEGMANFAHIYGAENVRYTEAEDAFDEEYAASVGMPEGVTRPDVDVQTVQEWEADLLAYLEPRKKADGPCMYILDSLDALSDADEMKLKPGEASYGTMKAKFLSEMFRKRNHLFSDRQCTLGVVSQLRDNIGVMFGEKKKRSGGKALDFYCSQIVWLAEKGKIKKRVLGAERIIGLDVLARTKKNKVGKPFRQADLAIYFSYGVDDEMSMLDWIHEHKCENLLALGEALTRKAVIEARENRDRDALRDLAEDIRSSVTMHWNRIENLLSPPLSKYGK